MRLLKKLGAALLIFGLLALLGVGVYMWRSQPQLTGQAGASGLKRGVSISRDASDVTHIFADNDADLAYALGYTHAQERSWQLETNRRIMHGQMSQIFGTATLELDKLMLSLGIARSAQEQYDRLPPEIKAVLQSYADGINGFHAQSKQALPPEFHILRTSPGLWQPSDSVGWSLMMALDLGGNWGNEMARFSAMSRINTQQLWQLFPPYPGEPPASKTDLAKLYADLGIYKKPSEQQQNAMNSGAVPAYSTDDFNGFDIKKQLKTALLNAQNAVLSAAGQEFQTMAKDMGNVEGKGSNNWVVAGRHTQSGKPLLANDPHLALGAPAIWYFARLQSKSSGLDAVGASLPGMPAVVLGRNAKVAWGFTNTGPDVQDLYIERINPANAKQYQTPEGWADFEERSASIAVRGQADVPYTYRASRHGPVLSDAQALHGKLIDTQRYAMALRWSALDVDNRTLVAAWRAQQAGSVKELFAAYADHHSPMQNVVAADTSGQVFYKAIGKAPIRSASNDIRGIAPAPGWEAKYDWQGYLPYEQTPQSDAPQGWHVTANQRIHGADYPHFLGQDWVTPERFDRANALIEEQIQAGKKHDMQSMARVQGDIYSLSAARLAPIASQAAQAASAHPLAAAAWAQLKNFDAQMKPTSAAPLILAAWADELARGLVAPKLGETVFKSIYGKRHFRGLIEQIYLKKEATAQAFWCAPKSCEEHSSAAMTRGLDRLQAQYGADISAWNWGNAHTARSIHRPFGNVPLLAKFFDVKTPTGGDPWSVNVSNYWLSEAQPFENRHAASLRNLFDLSDLEQSRFIYQTGQSGLVWSARYRDMSQEWANVQYRRLQLQPERFVSEFKLVPQ